MSYNKMTSALTFKMGSFESRRATYTRSNFMFRQSWRRLRSMAQPQNCFACWVSVPVRSSTYSRRTRCCASGSERPKSTARSNIVLRNIPAFVRPHRVLCRRPRSRALLEKRWATIRQESPASTTCQNVGRVAVWVFDQAPQEAMIRICVAARIVPLAHQRSSCGPNSRAFLRSGAQKSA
jgi:hypothetical protein